METVHISPELAAADAPQPLTEVPQEVSTETSGLPQLNVNELGGVSSDDDGCVRPMDMTAPPERGTDRARDNVALPEGAVAAGKTVELQEQGDGADENLFVDDQGQPLSLDDRLEAMYAGDGTDEQWAAVEEWAKTANFAEAGGHMGDDSLKHFHVGMDLGEPADTNAWRDMIRQGYEETGVEFDGNMDRAATCMASFEQGSKYVLDKLRERRVELGDPEVRIVNDPGLSDSESTMAASRERLYVNGRAIETAGDYSLDEVLTLPPPQRGEPPGMVGTMKEIFFLTGVEETHHYFHENARGPSPGYPHDVPHIEYHTNEPEYHALRWKLMAAKETGMPEATVAALENTYREATKLRRLMREAEVAGQ